MQKLLHFEDDKFWELINQKYSTKGGVYKIIAVRDKKRIPINRFLGTDNNGILYIGKATSFLNRVINLKKSISPKLNGSAHICGRRYKSIPNIEKQFPYDILYVDLIQTDEPEVLERKLLNDYVSIFGEVPPLNAI
jgi:hypothetical protein